MQKNSRISYLSIASVIVSVISVATFCLLFETDGMQKEIVSIVWVATGMISLCVPIAAKYFRKKNGKKGRRLEIVALILGFAGCDFVLVYAAKLNHNIDLLVCITLCVAYAKLFNNIAAPVSNEPVECCKEDNKVCEAETIAKCNRCGKEIPVESAYCPHCGKKVKRNVKSLSAASMVIIIALVMFILFSCAFLFYCFTNYQNGMNAMFSQNFIAADMQFRKIPYAERFFKNELEYISAGVLMEKGDYVEALNAFNAINYPVPISIIENIQESLYTQSQRDYKKGDYQNALIGFKAIRDYKNSEDYLLLIRGHNAPYIVNYNDLLDLIGFEDAADIISSTDTFFNRFIRGKWKSEAGGKYFEIDSERKSSYNLPFYNVYGGYYYFSEGEYIEVDSKEKETKQFKFFIIDENTVSVLCYKNNQRIKLVRQ